MADRTCKPDADFKLLWRTLLPGTPFPACGSAEHAVADGIDGPAEKSQDDTKPNTAFGIGRR
ncbi:MAG: hypothetical protein WAL80_05830 [Xanthobacteraceae bacterium]|jgi:hypothetical protein